MKDHIAMDGIFLLLGSNVGDRLSNLQSAISFLLSHQISIKKKSSVYETEPWGKSEQGWFLNAVLMIETTLSADNLLKTSLNTELAIGRKRELRWGPREIDIDILYYNDCIIRTRQLQVPHPGIPDRRFTLLPLVELSGDFIDPSSGKKQVELLAVCKDQLKVHKTEWRL